MSDTLLELPHIQLTRAVSGELCLMVEDTELNDFVEDYLVEGFGYEPRAVELRGDVHVSLFPEDFPAEGLVAALRQLDLDELERIYRLNH